MVYDKTKANGNAGEYLVAFKFTRAFNWPCRLFGVDIGVDAELEVLDEKGGETGNVIKIQVKAFDEITPTAEHRFSAYVDERHIRYWKIFCAPVVVCAVDLKNEIIYWKSILATHPYETNGESKKVTFCTLHDRLDANSIKSFRALVVDQKADELQAHFKVLYDKVPHLKGAMLFLADNGTIDVYRAECAVVRDSIDAIKRIVEFNPWRIGVLDWRNLEAASDAVRLTLNACAHAEADIAEGS